MTPVYEYSKVNDVDEHAILEALEIDLDVAECGEILTAHNVNPTAALVAAMWNWKEEGRCTAC